MNIKTKISLIFWGICASCYAQTPFTCHVKLDKPFHGKVIVAKIIDRLTGLDTLEVSGKDFTVKYNIQQAEEYRILSRPFTFDISVLPNRGVITKFLPMDEKTTSQQWMEKSKTSIQNS